MSENVFKRFVNLVNYESMYGSPESKKQANHTLKMISRFIDEEEQIEREKYSDDE